MSRVALVDQDDEIQQYIEARYIGTPEGAWRLFAFPIHDHDPSVQYLPIHLPNQQPVLFAPDLDLEQLLAAASELSSEGTQLLAFFELCRNDAFARTLTYPEVPKFYKLDKIRRKYVWLRRKPFGGGQVGDTPYESNTISRLGGAPPSNMPLYCLKLLLFKVRGPTSFEDLRRPGPGEPPLPTFEAAAQALGLINDDIDYAKCLQEAVVDKMPWQIRSLFVMILCHCSPPSPLALWERFKDKLAEDHLRMHHSRLHVRLCDPLPQDAIHASHQQALTDINELLLGNGSSLRRFEELFALWEPPSTRTDPVRDEIDQFDAAQQQRDYEEARQQLNTNQLRALDAIKACLDAEDDSSSPVVAPRLFFVDGPAGTGKTRLFNAVLSYARGQGHLALPVATSAVAAQLLPGGRTAHNRFGIPVHDLNESSTCFYSRQDRRSKVAIDAKIIIWDEAVMMSRYGFEAVDRYLQDIMSSNVHFGGKIVVFGGDFRQLLPVVRKGSPADVVAVTMNSSDFWQHVQILRLTENMRIASATPHLYQGDFAEFLRNVGNGVGTVTIPSYMRRDTGSIGALLNHAYPNFSLQPTPRLFKSRTIIAPLHVDVKALNEMATTLFPGRERIMYSFDSIMGETPDENNPSSLADIDVPALNVLTPDGFPSHKLRIKKGMPMFITRNISPVHGLYNGTRVLIVDVQSSMIAVVKLQDIQDDDIDLSGARAFSNQQVHCLSRIKFVSREDEFPVQVCRLQYPLAPAFATTIHKSQGATYDHVVVYLASTPVFAHGQLYVALSRVTNPDNLRVVVSRDAENVLTNIVSREVLQNT